MSDIGDMLGMAIRMWIIAIAFLATVAVGILAILIYYTGPWGFCLKTPWWEVCL